MRFVCILILAMTLTACGRSVTITVIDEHSGQPLSDYSVAHQRRELRCMVTVLYAFPITKAAGKTDANGQIVFKNVRNNDMLCIPVGDIGGHLSITLIHPLWPVAKTKISHDPDATERYRTLNANTTPDRITLPFRRERNP